MEPTDLCRLLLGTWGGKRNSLNLRGEKVMSVWEMTLSGSFLRESWFTSPSKGLLDQNASAFFRVADGSPAEFYVIYKNGKMGMGTSEIVKGDWRVLHSWFGGPDELNEVRISFQGDDKYRQVVRRLRPDGPKLMNDSILVRSKQAREIQK